MADLNINLRGGGLHEIPMQSFAEYIEEVVNVEAPVHKDEVLRRIMVACRVTRAGNRIQDAYKKALSHALCSRKKIKNKKEFLWSIDGVGVKVRNRSGLDGAARKIDMIAPEEIAEAFKLVVEKSHSIADDELLTIVASSFGLQRLTENIRSTLKRHLIKLIEAGIFIVNGSVVSMPR